MPDDTFMDWGDKKDEGQPFETKILMRNIGAQQTAGTVAVDTVNQELSQLRAQGWYYLHIGTLRSAENSFAMVFVLEREVKE